MHYKKKFKNRALNPLMRLLTSYFKTLAQTITKLTLTHQISTKFQINFNMQSLKHLDQESKLTNT